MAQLAATSFTVTETFLSGRMYKTRQQKPNGSYSAMMSSVYLESTAKIPLGTSIVDGAFALDSGPVFDRKMLSVVENFQPNCFQRNARRPDIDTHWFMSINRPLERGLRWNLLKSRKKKLSENRDCPPPLLRSFLKRKREREQSKFVLVHRLVVEPSVSIFEQKATEFK